MTFAIGRNILPRPSEKSEPALPSIPRRSMNAAKSIAQATANFVKGQPMRVSDATKAKRTAICRSNTCGKYRASDDHCSKCGCPVQGGKPIDGIAELFFKRCPMNPPLWGPGEMQEKK